MLKNYFKVGLRNISRSKGYALLNVLGLAVGLACTLLITAYVVDELSFDKFHPKGDRVFRVALERHFPDRERIYAQTPLPMAAALLNDYPEVVRSTRMFKNNQDLRIRREEQDFYERSYLLADSSFFSIFGVPLLEGVPSTALSQPNSIVLTEASAFKYFGKEEALGKMLIIGDTNQFIVTGICSDMSSKSHIKFDFLLSMISYQQVYTGSFWGSYNAYTYIELSEGSSKEELEKKLPETVKQYVGPQLESVLGVSYDEYLNAGNIHNYFLQPIGAIHLKSNFQGEIKPNGSLSNVYLFATISLFTLLIACINFINLATAQAGNRAKEVGVRKAIGSSKASLIKQFLMESIMLSSLATLVAVIMVIILLPYFNDVASKSIELSVISPWGIMGSVVLVALSVGIFSGLYPAFYLASFDTNSILKGNYDRSRGKPKMRNVLVVFQFSISVLLSIATLAVYEQMNYMKNKDLGFDKNRILIIDKASMLGTGLSSFRNEILDVSGIEGVSSSNSLPGRQLAGGTFEAVGMSNTERFLHTTMRTDYDFYKTYGLELVEGRFFNRDIASDDSLSIVLNEAAVKMVGWKKPIGKLIQPVFGPQLEVIGVVKDFNFSSLHEKISPLVMFGYDLDKLQNSFPEILSLRLSDIGYNNIRNIVATIEEQWDAQVGDRPMDYSFLDLEFDAQYRQEEQFGKVFLLFSILVVFIAVIGVTGLATFMAAQRKKEIGVRKVLGASSKSIWFLLSREFVILVGITNLLMWPTAYFAIESWLVNYPYSIEQSLWAYIFVGLGSLVLVLITVGFQSQKAARANPVHSIRNE